MRAKQRSFLATRGCLIVFRQTANRQTGQNRHKPGYQRIARPTFTRTRPSARFTWATTTRRQNSMQKNTLAVLIGGLLPEQTYKHDRRVVERGGEVDQPVAWCPWCGRRCGLRDEAA